MKNIIYISIIAGALMVGAVFPLAVQAGQERHKDRNHEEGEGHRAGRTSHFKPVTNQTYNTTCGGCHLAYPSMLLPASSWKKIVDQLEDHFGEQVPIDPQSKEIINRYLMENGAERSSSKEAVKIMRCLKGKTPSRITEIPYIRRLHRKIPLEVFNRKKIGSLSNCLACHQTADRGNFDEHYVAIPN